jgi:uncharacterized protein (DUF983 family)|tara:strand:+ start:191 stop:418 length:228 start_codon:yes stop_codon:yes gene_type:complete
MSNNFFSKDGFIPEVTHGTCPTCKAPTMLVSMTRDFYRCVTCGSDLEQKVNGVIKYIPTAAIQQISGQKHSGQKV